MISRSGCYGHGIRERSPGHYEIFWMINYKYDQHRWVYPRRFHQMTDRAGALRFAKLHGCQMPSERKSR